MIDGAGGAAPRGDGDELEGWLSAALAVGRDRLGLSLKAACRELAGVSDKTLMKWEAGERLHPLRYAIELARFPVVRLRTQADVDAFVSDAALRAT